MIEKTIITDFYIDEPTKNNQRKNNILTNNKPNTRRKNLSISDFTKYLNKMGLANNNCDLHKANSSQNLLKMNLVYKRHNNIYKETKSAINSPKSEKNKFFIFNTFKKEINTNKYNNNNKNWYNPPSLTNRKTQMKTFIHKKYVYNGINKPNNDLNLTEIKNVNNNNNKVFKQIKLFRNNYPNEINKEKNSIKSINKNNLIDLIYSPKFNRNNNNNFSKINKLNLSFSTSNINIHKEKFNLPKIIKLNKSTPININPQKELYLGLELADTECRISIMNQENNSIELGNLEGDEYSIPLMISFSENKKEIKIGKEAKNNLLDNPSQTIFNITKFFGKKMKDINYEILPFKIYSKNNDENKPFIKINFGPQKDKIIYMDNILSIYLQKLFEKFFQKIKLEPLINTQSIKTTLVITVPNHFSYYQRKLLELIFKQEVIPKINNNKNIKLNLILEKIYIKNTSDITPIGLSIFEKIKNNIDSKNILVIKIDKESTNLSLISKGGNKNKINFKIKANSGMEKGTNYILNEFIMYILNNKLDLKIKNEIINSPLAIIILRNLCNKIILNLSKSYKIKFNLNEILSKDNSIFIDINLKEYEYYLYNYVYDLKQTINKMIEKYDINLKIDEIIFIGDIFKNENIKSEIKQFLNQKQSCSVKEINNIINEDINKEYYTISGTAFYAMNIKNNIKLLEEISQYNIGIKAYNDYFHYLIKKGYTIPFKNKTKIKIGKTSELHLYEEDINTKDKILIAKYDINNAINSDEINIEYELNEELNIIIRIIDGKNFIKD